MSERIQKAARDRAEAARQRERNARERARRNQERGDWAMERLHRQSAELQADAAKDAEQLIELDQQIEGDQLDGGRARAGESKRIRSRRRSQAN
jgi:hypothetical protein